ncbi:hypothetical protein Trydic_g12575 [Trypoxylus dichotomus]
MPHPYSRGRYILEMAARTGLIVLNEREVTTFRRPGYSETKPDVSFASEALASRIVDWRVSENYLHRVWALPPVCRLIAGSEVDARERVERLVESTMSGIASACDASMPRKAPRHCKRAAYWWTAEIAELRRRCLRLRRIAQRGGNGEEANIRSRIIQQLSSRVIELEQQHKRHQLEIHGVPEQSGEDLRVIVLRVASVLDVPYNIDDIEDVYRATAKLKLPNKPKPLVVSFSTLRKKFQLLDQRRTRVRCGNIVGTSSSGVTNMDPPRSLYL